MYTRTVDIDVGETGAVGGDLHVPEDPQGVVVFAHGSGSSRYSQRNRFVAAALERAGFATLLFDLLTEAEDADRANRFDIELLTERLRTVAAWVAAQPALAGRPLGLFGASTGAAAALQAAARDEAVRAVVSRGGRPDLAGAAALAAVACPTLLIVGGADAEVLELNRQAEARLGGVHRLAIVPEATHLFPEPGALETVAELATAWFREHLAAPAPPRRPAP